MATELKQSTAASVAFGPFLDGTNGSTPETGLSIDASAIYVAKNGAAYASMNSSTSPEHDVDGWYPVELDTTDTGTLGRLVVQAHLAGALPVWREFSVVTTNYWDTKYSTDSFDVNVNGGVLSASDLIASSTIVDDVLGLSASRIEDTAASHSLATLIFMSTESSISGSEWTIYKSDGTTAYRVLSASVDGTASPIVAVG